MPEERKSQEPRLISGGGSERIMAVGPDRLRIEFQIEDLVAQLRRQASNHIIIASCGGCKGCSATV
jgi:hypothetical protein